MELAATARWLMAPTKTTAMIQTLTRSKTSRSRSRRAERWQAVGFVAAGGLLGSAARTVIATGMKVPEGELPIGTLLINLVGSFLLGLFLARREKAVTWRWSLQFWGIGLLGSFTTFSAFSVEALRLFSLGDTVNATKYVAVSVVGGLACVIAGERIGERT